MITKISKQFSSTFYQKLVLSLIFVFELNAWAKWHVKWHVKWQATLELAVSVRRSVGPSVRPKPNQKVIFSLFRSCPFLLLWHPKIVFANTAKKRTWEEKRVIRITQIQMYHNGLKEGGKSYCIPHLFFGPMEGWVGISLLEGWVWLRAHRCICKQ